MVDIAVARAAFLAALYDGCEGLLEFRAFNGRRGAPPVGRVFCAPLDASVCARVVADHHDHEVYFGVATRADDSAGTLENCRHLAAVFADIDFKMAAEAEARGALARFPLPPSAVVQSGGGLHVYWFLREPLDLRDSDARTEAYQLLRRLAGALHADMAAAEPARVLRVPGTVNRKPEYGAPRPVVVEILEPDRRYNPADFDWLPPLPTADPPSNRHFALPETIRDGERNATLFRLARSSKARNMTAGAILAALLEENRVRCVPPLSDGEVADIVQSAMRQPNRPDFAATVQGGDGEGQAGDAEAIYAHDGDLARVTEHAIAALVAKNTPAVVFSFGGVPTRIEHDEHGAPFVRVLTLDRMRHRLARVASWYGFATEKAGKDAPKAAKKRIPAKPPRDVAADVLATPDLPFPRLTRIVEAPCFTATGRLHATRGYDPESGLLFAPPPGFTMPAVSPAPSAEEIRRAVSLIVDDLLGDFPFTGDAERAHAIALLLLPFVRDMIDGATPLHMVEKPKTRTGASLLVEVTLWPALGRAVETMGAPRDEAEMTKKLTAALRRGRPAIFFDNLSTTRRLDSGELARAVTSRQWGDRVLGLSEDVSLPVRCLFVATGNNPRTSAEIAGRMIRTRLDAPYEHPEDRQDFRHPDLRGWVRDHRPELVWSALTLGQAWITAGRPAWVSGADAAILGGFAAWMATLGGILAIAQIPGFLMNLKDAREAGDAEGAAVRGFLTAWWTEHGTDRVTVGNSSR